MTAWQVASFPKHFACFSIEAGGAKAAEVNIDPARRNDRRRSGVTVHGSAVAERFGIVAVKDLLVKANLAGFGIDTDGEKVVAILGGSGQPDLAGHNYWSGPTAVGD